MPTAKSQALSLGLHVALVALLFLLASLSVHHPLPAIPADRFPPLLRLVLPRRSQQRAGGSNRSAVRARRGTPPPTARRTFIPPISQPNPRLPLPMTVAFDTPTIMIASSTTGDPFSKLIDGEFGTSNRGGIGKGCCKGIGPSPGGTPGLSAARARNVTRPQLIYKIEPEFSEEARKAKFQGVVVLAIEVDANGRVRNPRVVQPLGLGLDERAIEAVLQWRFRPGTRDGKPVPAQATVEVSFQLL